MIYAMYAKRHVCLDAIAKNCSLTIFSGFFLVQQFEIQVKIKAD